MDETMMEELKAKLVAHMERTRSLARDYEMQGYTMLARHEWNYYYGLDWVLDTMAELEIKHAREVSQEGGETV